MTVRMTARDITRGGSGYVLERADIEMDVDDPHAREDLLRRTSRRYRMPPGDVELELYAGPGRHFHVRV